VNLLTAHCSLRTSTAVLIWAIACTPAEAWAQEEQRCQAAEHFLVELVGMTAVSRPDTIDDWRSRKMVPGCRVMAAGLTSRGLAEEATLFYERLRAVGWIRTPDPRDAPNESSLRFRQDGTDCLFNFYTGGILGTEDEIEVNTAVVPKSWERRYNFLVLCMPAMEAAPR
jgi:hypothetical protein